MSSQRRIEASRANGARSHGPVTPEGKARSAMNGLRHGLLAQTVVLPVESRDLFEASLAAFIARLRPEDEVELALVEQIAVADWRLRRCWGVETHLFTQAADSSAAPDAAHGLTAGYASLAATPTLAVINRCEGRLVRMQRQALALLQDLRKMKKSTDEPSPISEHSEPVPGPDPDPPSPAAAPPLPPDPELLRRQYAALLEKLRNTPLSPELETRLALLPDPELLL